METDLAYMSVMTSISSSCTSFILPSSSWGSAIFTFFCLFFKFLLQNTSIDFYITDLETGLLLAGFDFTFNLLLDFLKCRHI